MTIHKSGDESPIKRRHGRSDEDTEADILVYARAEDRSVWFRLAYLQQKYSILMVPLVVLVMLGARTWLHDAMKDTTQQLQTQIDSTRTMIRTEIAIRDSVNRKLVLLFRVVCISPAMASKRDLALVGLHCDELGPSIVP